MIPRYSRPEMAAIWTEHAKLQRWLDVELAVCRAWCRRGVIPADDLAQIEAKAAFSVERTLEIEKTTNHDVVAFLTNVNENIGPASRWVHYGMTSSDVLDTGLALAMVQSGTLLVAAQAALTQALKARALEHRDTLCVGRTHGVHAEPTTFGLRLAGFALESRRNEERLKRAHEQIAYGKLSGAVGTYAMLDPAIEAEVMDELGLKCEPIATQVIPRDRHAEVVTQMALAASSLERLAVERRHLQRTEVREAEEAFGKGQKGSSAMPHKRNPIGCEQIVGMARLLRGNLVAALENNALWHERDISHSSVERVILPDTFIALDHMLRRMTRIVTGMAVYPQRMLENLNRSRGVVFSGTVLLELARRGVSREQAYEWVQRNAMRSFHEAVDFKALLLADADVTRVLPAAEIERAFDLNEQLRHVDHIFNRVFTRS